MSVVCVHKCGCKRLNVFVCVSGGEPHRWVARRRPVSSCAFFIARRRSASAFRCSSVCPTSSSSAFNDGPPAEIKKNNREKKGGRVGVCWGPYERFWEESDFFLGLGGEGNTHGITYASSLNLEPSKVTPGLV